MNSVRVVSPFPAYAVRRLWLWVDDVRRQLMDDFGPQDEEAFIESLDELAANETVQTWGVYRDEELGGFVQVQRHNARLASAHIVFKKSFFGRKTTMPALIQIFGEVFDSGIDKISSSVFADNVGIVSLAEALGAKREGLLRKQTTRGGESVDMIPLGLLKEDFDLCHRQ